MSIIEMNTRIFISYSWNRNDNDKVYDGEVIANKIYEHFKSEGLNIILDKKEVGYKDNIEKFEKKLGRSNYIILIINDKFLKSKHCMFEVLKIIKQKKVHARIFPIILDNAKIFDDLELLNYSNYWNNKVEKLEQSIKEMRQIAHLKTALNQLKVMADIARVFNGFAGKLQKMNMLNGQTHASTLFKDLKAAIQKQMNLNIVDRKKTSSYYAKEKNLKIKQTKHRSPNAKGNVSMKGKYVSGRDININK